MNTRLLARLSLALVIHATAAPAAAQSMQMCSDGVMRMSCSSVRRYPSIGTTGIDCTPPVRGSFSRNADGVHRYNPNTRPKLWR